MKITMRPHQDFTGETWGSFPELHEFVSSLGLPKSLAEAWFAVCEAELEPDGTISVFNMAASIPERLLEKKEWVFRFSRDLCGCLIFEINGIPLGLSVDFDAKPVISDDLLKNVRCLILERLSDPDWVDRLSRMDQLEGLHVSDSRLLRDLHPLSGLKNLRTLVFRRNVEDVDRDGYSFTLWSDRGEERQLRDVSALAGLKKLTRIDLDGCGLLTDLSPLSGLPNLTDLRLYGCKSLRDLSALAGLTGLKYLSLDWHEILEENEENA